MCQLKPKVQPAIYPHTITRKYRECMAQPCNVSTVHVEQGCIVDLGKYDQCITRVGDSADAPRQIEQFAKARYAALARFAED